VSEESRKYAQEKGQKGNHGHGFAGLFSSSLSSLVFASRGLREVKTGLSQVAYHLLEEVQEIARHPRALGLHIDEKSPWLSRRFLGAASNLLEPFLLGMGLRVERLEDEMSEVSMPGYLRNQGDGGGIHPAALCALGEFTTRLFWEHHLDLRHSEMVLEQIDSRMLAQARGDMRALFRTTTASREEVLHRLRLNSAVQVQSLATIYDVNGRLVSEIEVSWKISRHLALGGKHAT
jgi:hypothetical protein